jgi:hypothetical protein
LPSAAQCPRADILLFDPCAVKGTLLDLVIKTMRWGKDTPSEEGAKAKDKHYAKHYTFGSSMLFHGVSFDTYNRPNTRFSKLLCTLSRQAADGDMALHSKTLSRARNIIQVSIARVIADRITDVAIRCMGLAGMPEPPRGASPPGPFCEAPPPVVWYHPLTEVRAVQWDVALPTATYYVSSRVAQAPGAATETPAAAVNAAFSDDEDVGLASGSDSEDELDVD